MHVHVISLMLGASVTTSIGLTILLSTVALFVALAIQAAGRLGFLLPGLARDEATDERSVDDPAPDAEPVDPAGSDV